MSRQKPNSFEDALSVFQKNPGEFYREILGTTLEGYQEDCLKIIAANDRTAIAACHDLGKTFLIARLVPWFISCFKYSKVITTAPTYNQVKNILWSEIRSAHTRARHPLGGEINLTEWKIEDGWFAIGFTPRNEAGGFDEGQGTQSSFQGFHAEGGVLVIFDEATGIPPNIWTMAEGLLTSAHVKFVGIGNPTSRNSEFYQCFRSPSWAKVYLSCFDSPNLIVNGITDREKLIDEINKVKSMTDQEAKEHLDDYKVVRPYLLTAKWVVEQSRKWGIDHPLTVSKILGKFPAAGDKTLIPLGFVEDAQLRVVYPSPTDRKSIGVDVARFGTDSTVITALHGFKHLERRELFKHDTVSVTGEVIAMAKDLEADIIVVDETGIGGGVVDLLNDAVSNGDLKCEIRGVQFGAACESDEEKEKFVNLKARMFRLLSTAFKEGQHLLNDSIYAEELPTIQYRYDKKGREYIESKDEYKRRTGRGSPDSADSLALAHYGMHDELTVGKFTRDFADTTEHQPRSGGLRSEKKW